MPLSGAVKSLMNASAGSRTSSIRVVVRLEPCTVVVGQISLRKPNSSGGEASSADVSTTYPVGVTNGRALWSGSNLKVKVAPESVDTSPPPESSAFRSRRFAPHPRFTWRVRAVVYVVVTAALRGPRRDPRRSSQPDASHVGAGLVLLDRAGPPRMTLEPQRVSTCSSGLCWVAAPCHAGRWARHDDVGGRAHRRRHSSSHRGHAGGSIAITLEVIKILIVVFGPERPVAAGLSEVSAAVR